MNDKTYYRVTSAIFAVIAVGHLLRALYQLEAVIGGVVIPLWMSWAAVAIAGYLAYRGFTTKKGHGKK